MNMKLHPPEVFELHNKQKGIQAIWGAWNSYVKDSYGKKEWCQIDQSQHKVPLPPKKLPNWNEKVQKDWEHAFPQQHQLWPDQISPIFSP